MLVPIAMEKSVVRWFLVLSGTWHRKNRSPVRQMRRYIASERTAATSHFNRSREVRDAEGD